MQNLGSILILTGMALMMISQFIGFILILRVSFLKGIFTLFIPGYLLITLRRTGYYWKVVGAWTMGILGYVIGTILLS